MIGRVNIFIRRQAVADLIKKGFEKYASGRGLNLERKADGSVYEDGSTYRDPITQATYHGYCEGATDLEDYSTWKPLYLFTVAIVHKHGLTKEWLDNVKDALRVYKEYHRGGQTKAPAEVQDAFTRLFGNDWKAVAEHLEAHGRLQAVL
jgi:hypothetical protein